MCNPKSNHLPHQFYLPAPKIAATKYSIKDGDDSFSSYGENNHDRLLNKGNLATFILRIKDIGLTKSTTTMNGISSAFASSSSSSTLSLSSFGSVLSNNNNNDLILTSGSAFPSNPGIVRSHDYLSVDARKPNVYDGSLSNITIIRFCLINNSTLKTIATRTKTKLPEVEMINSSSSLSSPYSSISSGSFPLNSIDYNKLYAPDESYLVGQIYDSISNVYGLRFTSNWNLLDPYIIHGKGIVLEYIEPMDPALDEINPSQSSSSFSSTGNRSSLNNNNIPNSWWLQHGKLI
ncbi:unnamed protein product [Schistosoma curassoni]|nr:unnamed protein product [Schistosoma curassoni]